MEEPWRWLAVKQHSPGFTLQNNQCTSGKQEEIHPLGVKENIIITYAAGVAVEVIGKFSSSFHLLVVSLRGAVVSLLYIYFLICIMSTKMQHGREPVRLNLW